MSDRKEVIANAIGAGFWEPTDKEKPSRLNIRFQLQGEDGGTMTFNAGLETEKALKMSQEALETAGYDLDTMDLEIYTSALPGKDVVLVLAEDDYFDDGRMKILFVNSTNRGVQPGAKLDELKNRLRRAVKKKKQAPKAFGGFKGQEVDNA